MEGIRRALVQGLVLLTGTALEQAPSVGSLSISHYHSPLTENKTIPKAYSDGKTVMLDVIKSTVSAGNY